MFTRSLSSRVTIGEVTFEWVAVLCMLESYQAGKRAKDFVKADSDIMLSLETPLFTEQLGEWGCLSLRFKFLLLRVVGGTCGGLCGD